ncbi:c-type cytochrome [Bartonella tamiae]|uniref:Cytochrome c domain-containing protein n=1 Tax=Bartonella tamiae Th239 TaxID=1094558 RepID=J1JW47_9HYPH|nr:cytochrome c family protein [Bartonella tamiae]EJF88805.1 hypothetical protein ME5_01356 [Bartonella tamiae Th239]EJF94945.1 hypothetical protein MEG_00526 [Bartonella tamiae Th307]
MRYWLTFFILISSCLFLNNAFSADIEKGKLIFKRCSVCHNIDKPNNKVGPTLLNVIGRQAGSLKGYNFSPAMTNAGENGLMWDRENLITYLHNPRAMIKGTRMATVRLQNDDDIDDLIAYIKSASTSDQKIDDSKKNEHP